MTEIISVGIDVGTTTTQLVLSRLRLDAAPAFRTAPRARIAGREILYQSPIWFTPVINLQEVDAAAVRALVMTALADAGLRPGDIQTGAVIVTGEIAKTRNAEALVRELSQIAGEFVVSTAGPDLEAVMAGRGSGAAAYSASHFASVVNIDVGGGTANAARFDGGSLTGTSAINIGGRLVQIDPATGMLRAVASPAAHIVALLGLGLRAGAPADQLELDMLCNAMADGVIDLALGRRWASADGLQLSPPGALPALLDANTLLSFSGGVGYYVYESGPHDAGLPAGSPHGDIGLMLGIALRAHPLVRRFAERGRLLRPQPQQTRSATVIGAAMQTITLSGATIWHSPGALPVRNLPVVALSWRPGQGFQARLPAGPPSPSALAIDLPVELSFPDLERLTGDLVKSCAAWFPADATGVIVLARDYAQILGGRLARAAPERPWVVVDQVALEVGDLIDIGTPAGQLRAVPLSIKTLVFY